ncbi:MAG: MarP family serine protease [Nocardioidaceae bacterium]|nr:MarP family serine protease [Nocardioidaceae bacterium]
MNVLDIVLVVAVVAYGLSGYWQGFIAGVAATIGLLAGGALGVLVVPMFLDEAGDSLSTALIALFCVLLLAVVGQAIGSWIGGMLRQGITWSPARSVDAVGGAVLSMAAVLVVAWALGYAVSGAQIPGVSNAVRSSYLLSKVDAVMPTGADRALGAFNRIVDSNLFPRYLEPFAQEQITPIQPPDQAVLARSGVERAQTSVVKVLGQARCSRGIEGSGFVYAPDRIMTNAHVVAGVDNPFVAVGDRRLQAETVVYDPELDVAVLAVSGLDLPALDFDTTGARGDSAAVLGYPENGPFDARAARIRAEQNLRSPDIYNSDTVVREVFSLRSLVRSGNSGGPLVSDAGDVYGVIFAASVSDSSTGYALTADQVAANAERGRDATRAVPTGACA